MPAAKERTPRFKTVQSLQIDYAPVAITQYESTRTGMRVAVVDQKGPKVEGYFTLATEIHDDSGAPHTLEHLIFMGSRSYHYKGLLDKLSSRAFSTTNAWTAVDHTAYELKTAGWQGFAQILPTYLEHIVKPTLTDAACYTEVHHIDGEGNDAGVVYAEMQGCENMSSEIIDRRARELLYPPGCGFRSETGGLMKALRSLTADRIREFHHEMYQPKNLRLVLLGQIDHDELLYILDEFESTIVNDVPALDDPFKRPWVESERIPPLTQTKVERVEFPEDDESMGEISVGFMGPDCNDALANGALSVILTYLCGGSIAVIENIMVEREQLCSSILYYTETRVNVEIWFSMHSVETDDLQQVYQRLIELLKETTSKPFDMPYMQDCIERTKRRLKEQAETADNFFVTPIIEDHLFGHRDGRHLEEMASLRDLDVVEQWSEAEWRAFLSKWLADAYHVAVLGVPSKRLSAKISDDEEARLKAQKERLGEKGLKQLADKLERAQAENNQIIPDEVLGKWPTPTTTSVPFLTTTSARAGAARRMGKLDNPIQQIIDRGDDGGDDSSLFIHFEHIPSNFVQIRLVLGTSQIPIELKPLLSLYIANLFTSPVLEDGKRIEFEEVVLGLEKETTSYYVDSCPGNSQMLAIELGVEPKSYGPVIKRLRSILFDAIHDPVRLRASLTKMLAEIPEYKRDGDTMAATLNTTLHTERSSVSYATSILTRGPYLKRVKKLLKLDESAAIADFQRVCNALHRPENFRVYVAGNLQSLENPVTAWQILTKGRSISNLLEPLEDPKATLNELGRNPNSKAYIVPLSAIDSSFAYFTGKGPDSPLHPDFPALLVATCLLNAVEGPFWTAVRGEGLAYSLAFVKYTSLGLLSFMIYKSPDPYKAFAAAKEQVEGYASGRLEMNQFAIESAIGEIVINTALKVPTMTTAAADSFTNQVILGTGKEYSQELLARVGEVTRAQIKDAMAKYILPLFNPATASAVVTCSKGMAERAVANFSKAGFKAEQQSLDFFHDDYGLEMPGGDEGEEVDEDEDDEDELTDDEEGEDDGESIGEEVSGREDNE